MSHFEGDHRIDELSLHACAFSTRDKGEGYPCATVEPVVNNSTSLEMQMLM